MADAQGPQFPQTKHAELLDIVETIELGLMRGYTPAELLDENSPIRDRMRAAIAAAKDGVQACNWPQCTCERADGCRATRGVKEPAFAGPDGAQREKDCPHLGRCTMDGCTGDCTPGVALPDGAKNG